MLRYKDMNKAMLEKGKFSRPEGFTLLEVMISICILMAGLLAVGTMQVTAIYGNSQANRVTKATSMAEEKMEELLSLEYTLASAHADLSQGNHPVAPVTDASGYTTTWTVEDNVLGNQNTKAITVTVTWQNKGMAKSTSLSSYLSF
jgi:Tfp pilus assembly protein PilV